jgi:proton glutamate symport protein
MPITANRRRKQTVLLLTGCSVFTFGFLLASFTHSIGRYHIFALTLRFSGLTAILLYGLLRKSLTVWILMGMIVGAELGADAPTFASNLRIFSDIFLRLTNCIVAPLILSTLITGIAGHGSLKMVGRLAFKSLLYFEIVTSMALAIGLLAINITHAGRGIVLPTVLESLPNVSSAAPLNWRDFLLHSFPQNIAKSIADGEILQIAVFAILFGIGLALIPNPKRSPILKLAESVAETMFAFTNIIMYLAPFAICGSMAYTVGHMGIGVLAPLTKLIATFYSAALIFALIVFLPVALLARIPVRRFLTAVAEPAAIAFSTTSSEAALPVAMEAMENMGVPRSIVAFVFPLGYSFNLDGSTLYLAIASLFIAQAAGLQMSLSQQLVIVLTLMITSKGLAGVPRASILVLMGMITMFHMPTEPLLIILGIDSLMDMGRTTINVVGNSLASAVIARWEGQLDDVVIPLPVETLR